jgi:hypothetical protein
MSLSIKKISIIFFALLLIASCGKQAQDAAKNEVEANNEAEVSSTSNEANTTDKVYEEEYAKIFPKNDPKAAARKLGYEKGSVVAKNWDNEDFAECFNSVVRGDVITKKSPEKYAKDIETSKFLQQLMEHVFQIKIIYKEMTRKQFMNMVSDINSQISEDAIARPGKDAVWYEGCIKKTLEISHAMND